MNKNTKRRPTLPILVLLALATLGGATVHSDTAHAARPNILVAIADDMSWPHTSIAGCKGVHTQDPRIYGTKPDIADTYINVNPKNKMGEGNYPPPKTP